MQGLAQESQRLIDAVHWVRGPAVVEAGEEIIIARGDAPIAKLTRIEKADDLVAVLAEARAARARAKSVTREEVLGWRREGARGA